MINKMKILILIISFFSISLTANEISKIELGTSNQLNEDNKNTSEEVKNINNYIKKNTNFDFFIFGLTDNTNVSFFLGGGKFNKKLLNDEIKGGKGIVNWPTFKGECKFSFKFSSSKIKISCANATYGGLISRKNNLISATLNREYFTNDIFDSDFPKNLDIISFNKLDDLFFSINTSIANYVKNNLNSQQQEEVSNQVSVKENEKSRSNIDNKQEITKTELDDLIEKNEKSLLNSIKETFDLKIDENDLKQQIEFIEIANDSKKDFNLSFNLSENLLKYMKFSNDKIIDEFSKDYIFAYSVDKAVTRRLTQSRELHNSEYLYATQQIENPEYSKLLIEIQVISGQVDRAWASYERAKQRAEDYLSSQRSKSCGGGWADFFCGVAEGQIAENMYKDEEEKYNKLKERLVSMESELSLTPLIIEENIYDNYQYSTSDVKTIKYIEAVYHFINKREKTVQSLKIKNELSNDFSTVYNFHENDKNLKSIISKYNTEKDIVNWENSDAVLSLEDLITGIDKSKLKLRQFNTISKLEETIASINRIQIDESIQEEEKVSILSTKYDERFQSVVIIHNSSNNSIGTGFYITPNNILTNYHVIEGSPNPTISLFDQSYELVGRVIAADLRLDLAIIEVSHIGKPLTVATNSSITIGSEVEAIGHPFGNIFTLTRGIISAIRLSESTFMVGGKPVYYIQTDTAINSGNSGGPLFIDNTVVGVNTQVIRKDLAEGLNFAVHFEEVNDFINYHLKN